MQCPYFKKVNFHRIEQRPDIEQQTLMEYARERDRTSQSTQSIAHEFVEQSIPEQGCTNGIKVENYRRVRRYDSFNSVGSEEVVEDSDRVITIKMPKALKIREINMDRNGGIGGFGVGDEAEDKENCVVGSGKNFNKLNKSSQLSQILQEEISLQSESMLKHKQAKIFATHPNLFFETSFDSIIMLPATSEHCFCHLDKHTLKIISAQKCTKLYGKAIQIKQQTSNSYKVPNAKIRYFVNLKKYTLEVCGYNSMKLEITLLSKGGRQSFMIQFMSQTERETFQCVYASILEEKNKSYVTEKTRPGQKSKSRKQQGNNIEQQQQLSLTDSHYRQLKSQWSIDSLRFSVQRLSCKNTSSFLDTFDIVLFKGKNIMCKVQRFLTNSDYDHVGLVIKTVDGNLLLLEATGNVGVAIYSFSSIEMAVRRRLYERIAVRKFTALGEQGNYYKNMRLVALQQFIREVNGKKYKFDPMYLLSSNVDKNKNNFQNEQTYFCSQLVAEALKICGIMKKVKPSYKYLPKHFGDAEGLNFEIEDGFYYSDPIILQQ